LRILRSKSSRHRDDESRLPWDLDSIILIAPDYQANVVLSTLIYALPLQLTS
jgi:hypothetical protein